MAPGDVPTLVAALAEGALLVAAMVLVAPSREHRARFAAALGCVILAVAAPFFAAPDALIGRSLMALFVVLGLGRVLDFGRTPTFPLRVRLASLLMVHDPRRAVRVPARLDRARFVLALLLAAVAGLGTLIVATSPSLPAGAPRFLALWWGGLLVTYAAIDAINKLGEVLLAAAGVSMPPFHRDPILSRSLAEFWGARWNLTIHRWLLDHVARRFLRLGRGVAMGAAFVASGVMHSYLALAALGSLRWAAWIGAYFLIQAVGWALEASLLRGRLGGARGRIWTALWTVLPSPLFVVPAMQVVLPVLTGATP